MRLLDTQVDAAWVDYNGHMNDAEYARIFSLAVDELMVNIGLDDAGRKREGYTLFTLETHLCYRREAHEGEELVVDLALLDRDAKRLHGFFSLYNADGDLLATSEQMLMGIDTSSGRPAPFPDAINRQLDGFPLIDSAAWPEAAGRRIGITRRLLYLSIVCRRLLGLAELATTRGTPEHAQARAHLVAFQITAL